MLWKIIADQRQQASGDIDALARAVRAAGSAHGADFEEQYQQAMQRAHDRRLWSAAGLIAGCAIDEEAFSDFRSWLILQGRELFERALADPNALAEAACARPFTEHLGPATHGGDPSGPQWSDEEAVTHLPSLSHRKGADAGSLAEAVGPERLLRFVSAVRDSLESGRIYQMGELGTFRVRKLGRDEIFEFRPGRAIKLMLADKGTITGDSDAAEVFRGLVERLDQLSKEIELARLGTFSLRIKPGHAGQLPIRTLSFRAAPDLLKALGL